MKRGFSVRCWEVFACVFLWTRTCDLLPCSLWKMKQHTCMSSLKWTNGRNVVPLAVKHTALWVIRTRTLTRLMNTGATLLRWHICVAQMKYHIAILLFSELSTQSPLSVWVPPPPAPEGLKWEPKKRVMTLLCGKKKEKKYFLESFVLGRKNRVKNRWMKPGVSAAVASASPTSGRQKIQWLIGMLSAAARYEKKSVGSVINHSAERGGEDLMKRDKRTWLESTQRSLVLRLEYLRVLVTVLVRLKAGWLFFKSEPPQLISQQTLISTNVKQLISI